MLGKAIARSFSQLRNLHSFTNLRALETFLAARRPTYSLVYFRAAWNPFCARTDQELVPLAEANPTWTMVRVDLDVPEAQAIGANYKVKAEPEYVFCLYGDQAGRQIGHNDSALRRKLDRLVEVSKQLPEFTPEFQWRPYGSAALAFYREKVKRSKNISI